MKGYVYFIGIKENPGLIKIGYTTQSIKKRLYKLQISTPFKLYLIDSIKTKDCQSLEKKLHSHFSKFHIRGEWFNMPYMDIKRMSMQFLKEEKNNIRCEIIKKENCYKNIKRDISVELNHFSNLFITPDNSDYNIEKTQILNIQDVFDLHPTGYTGFVKNTLMALKKMHIKIFKQKYSYGRYCRIMFNPNYKQP